MDAEVTVINCWDNKFIAFRSIYSLSDIEKQLQKYGYKFSKLEDGFAVDLTIYETYVRINVLSIIRYDYDVGVIGWWVHSDKFIAAVKRRANFCKRRYPTAPILMVGNTELKTNPESLKDAELAGWKLINRKHGDKLAQEIGALKYIELSWRTGCGCKTLFEEIAIAGLGKLKADKGRKTNAKCDFL